MSSTPSQESLDAEMGSAESVESEEELRDETGPCHFCCLENPRNESRALLASNNTAQNTAGQPPTSSTSAPDENERNSSSDVTLFVLEFNDRGVSTAVSSPRPSGAAGPADAVETFEFNIRGNKRAGEQHQTERKEHSVTFLPTRGTLPGSRLIARQSQSTRDPLNLSRLESVLSGRADTEEESTEDSGLRLDDTALDRNEIAKLVSIAAANAGLLRDSNDGTVFQAQVICEFGSRGKRSSDPGIQFSRVGEDDACGRCVKRPRKDAALADRCRRMLSCNVGANGTVGLGGRQASVNYTMSGLNLNIEPSDDPTEQIQNREDPPPDEDPQFDPVYEARRRFLLRKQVEERSRLLASNGASNNKELPHSSSDGASSLPTNPDAASGHAKTAGPGPGAHGTGSERSNNGECKQSAIPTEKREQTPNKAPGPSNDDKEAYGARHFIRGLQLAREARRGIPPRFDDAFRRAIFGQNNSDLKDFKDLKPLTATAPKDQQPTDPKEGANAIGNVTRDKEPKDDTAAAGDCCSGSKDAKPKSSTRPVPELLPMNRIELVKNRGDANDNLLASKTPNKVHQTPAGGRYAKFFTNSECKDFTEGFEMPDPDTTKSTVNDLPCSRKTGPAGSAVFEFMKNVDPSTNNGKRSGSIGEYMSINNTNRQQKKQDLAMPVSGSGNEEQQDLVLGGNLTPLLADKSQKQQGNQKPEDKRLRILPCVADMGSVASFVNTQQQSRMPESSQRPAKAPVKAPEQQQGPLAETHCSCQCQLREQQPEDNRLSHQARNLPERSGLMSSIFGLLPAMSLFRSKSLVTNSGPVIEDITEVANKKETEAAPDQRQLADVDGVKPGSQVEKRTNFTSSQGGKRSGGPEQDGSRTLKASHASLNQAAGRCQGPRGNQTSTGSTHPRCYVNYIPIISVPIEDVNIQQAARADDFVRPEDVERVVGSGAVKRLFEALEETILHDGDRQIQNNYVHPRDRVKKIARRRLSEPSVLVDGQVVRPSAMLENAAGQRKNSCQDREAWEMPTAAMQHCPTTSSGCGASHCKPDCYCCLPTHY